MILAEFCRGPYDGERLVLPTDVPWPQFVIPKFSTVTIEYFYLYSGCEEDLYFYLYDEFRDFSGVIPENDPDSGSL